MIRVMSRKLVRKTIEMIRKLAEVKEEEEDDEEELEDEEYEDEDYDDEDDEEEDDEEEDDEYDDEFEEKTEEELKEEKEQRDLKRQQKIETYERFWKEFGKNIKLGIIEDPGNRNKLARVTRWYSTNNSTQLISLD
jgi:heat shock protein beta